jgi:hypothetical protein
MKKVLILFCAIFFFVVSIGAAELTLPYNSTWEYGSAIQGNLSRKVWSNLMSKEKSHSTSVAIGSKKGASGIKNKNVWAYSSAYGSGWEQGKSYYYFH